MPPGYVGVIVCDTRRAEQWRQAFTRAGVPAHVEETEAGEAHLGACRVAVPRDRLIVANAMITNVTTGRESLDGSWFRLALVLGIAALCIVLMWLAR